MAADAGKSQLRQARERCCVLQLEEIRACVDEYSQVGIWEVQEGPSGDPIITFYTHCQPF